MKYPIFLSLVCVVRDQHEMLEGILSKATDTLTRLVAEHELVIVDNASDDDSLAALKSHTGVGGLPDIQVYALLKEVDFETAAWVGVENALGDYVAVIDPLVDDLSMLDSMLENAVLGADVVLAHNAKGPRQGAAYRLGYAIFNRIYQACGGVDLSRDAPQYRMLSRRVVNFMLQYPDPVAGYRHLPVTSGFTRRRLEYASDPLLQHAQRKTLRSAADRGMRVLVSSTRAPMRAVAGLSLFGASVNLIYAVYVVAVALFKPDVEPGWVSLSLQMSGMFFLISLVLWVLGEYMLNMARLTSEGPTYHIAQEFTSAHMTRRAKLNVEEGAAATPLQATATQPGNT